MQCHIAGRKLSMPIIVAPMSQQRMAHDEGELAVARAVAKEDTAMVSLHVFSIAGHCNMHAVGQLRPCDATAVMQLLHVLYAASPMQPLRPFDISQPNLLNSSTKGGAWSSQMCTGACRCCPPWLHSHWKMLPNQAKPALSSCSSYTSSKTVVSA